MMFKNSKACKRPRFSRECKRHMNRQRRKRLIVAKKIASILPARRPPPRRAAMAASWPRPQVRRIPHCRPRAPQAPEAARNRMKPQASQSQPQPLKRQASRSLEWGCSRRGAALGHPYPLMPWLVLLHDLRHCRTRRSYGFKRKMITKPRVITIGQLASAVRSISKPCGTMNVSDSCRGPAVPAAAIAHTMRSMFGNCHSFAAPASWGSASKTSARF
jgi:hypothetical protein